MPFIAIFIILSAVAFFAWYDTYVRKQSFTSFNPHKQIFKKRLSPDQVNILFKYSKYYKMLPEKLKPYYENRMLRFLKEKNFITKGEIHLTEEMKLLVADSAIKLTFGLKDYKFQKFPKIIIFKGDFFSDFSKSQNKGETNPAGAIVFSWRDLLEGDANDMDGINLGLHEFAHALMIQNIGVSGWEDEYFLYKTELLYNFYNNSEKLDNVRTHHLFREYAFRNEMEFFSVAIEHFFEGPHRIKSDLPELYSILSRMLNQDTSRFYPVDKYFKKENINTEGQKESGDSIPPDQPHQT
ncbi:MAG: zinc-dependent peptidase [Bacteroidota bacterium]